MLKQFHYRPHLNSPFEMRAWISELYSTYRRLSRSGGYRLIVPGSPYWLPPPGDFDSKVHALRKGVPLGPSIARPPYTSATPREAWRRPNQDNLALHKATGVVCLTPFGDVRLPLGYRAGEKPTVTKRSDRGHRLLQGGMEKPHPRFHASI